MGIRFPRVAGVQYEGITDCRTGLCGGRVVGDADPYGGIIKDTCRGGGSAPPVLRVLAASRAPRFFHSPTMNCSCCTASHTRRRASATLSCARTI